MKSTGLISAIGILASLAALALTFVSATSYQTLFSAIVVLAIVASVCLLPALVGGSTRRVIAGIALLAAAYAVMDVVMRSAFGMRVLDLLR